MIKLIGNYSIEPGASYSRREEIVGWLDITCCRVIPALYQRITTTRRVESSAAGRRTRRTPPGIPVFPGVHPTDLAGFPGRWCRLAAAAIFPQRKRVLGLRGPDPAAGFPRDYTATADRYRCSRHRYPSPSPARYLPTPPSAGRPARAPLTRAGYPGPPGSPAAGSAEASGCALAHRARRAAHPAGQFACHGAPAPPRRDCHRRAPGASKWRNCAKLIGLYQCPPRGGQYQATSSQPSAGGGSRLVRVDPGNGSYPAGPGVGRRSLFPRHVAPHRYTRTGARYS